MTPIKSGRELANIFGPLEAACNRAQHLNLAPSWPTDTLFKSIPATKCPAMNNRNEITRHARTCSRHPRVAVVTKLLKNMV
jgi:hypothetical protein